MTALLPPKKLHAFTLIELMVVLAITAILSSFAIPVVASTSWQTPSGAHANQDYIRKTHVTEAVSVAKHVWYQIADNALNGVTPLSNGIKLPTPTTCYQISPNYSSGAVDIVFPPSKFNGQQYYMTILMGVQTAATTVGTITPGVIPDGRLVHWCISAAANKVWWVGMPIQYVPDFCKATNATDGWQ